MDFLMLKRLVGFSVAFGILASPATTMGQASSELTPQTLAEGLRRQLPITLDDGSIITNAAASDFVSLELTIEGANWPSNGIGRPTQLMGSTAARTVTNALCGNKAIFGRFLDNHQVIYLDLPATQQGPVRYKLSGNICEARIPRPVEVAMPLPALSSPATIHYSQSRRSVSFQSCDDWESRLATVEPNNAWLMNYRSVKLTKREFEATAAFELRRTERHDPFVSLAFEIDPNGLTYNADRLMMRVDLPDYTTLSRSSVLNDIYLGTSAFGAMTEVERSRERVFTVRFENARSVLPDDRFLPMNANAAMALKTRGVIRVLASVIGQDESYLQYRRPSLDDPRDTGALINEVTVRPFCVAVMVDGQKLTNWQEF
ncbi:MAG: hypothetical protein V2J51_13290 [Erythrobacter sp.]|nr:hypothetical protein [Erythrobacter sp.]